MQAQEKVYNILKEKWDSGDKHFYSESELRKIYISQYGHINSLNNSLKKLFKYRFIVRRTKERVYRYRISL